MRIITLGFAVCLTACVGHIPANMNDKSAGQPLMAPEPVPSRTDEPPEVNPKPPAIRKKGKVMSAGIAQPQVQGELPLPVDAS